jgi:hypothetical protein
LRDEEHRNLGVLQQGLRLRPEGETLPRVAGVSGQAEQIGVRTRRVLVDRKPGGVPLQYTQLAPDTARLEVSRNASR